MTKKQKAEELQQLAFERLRDAVGHVWAIHEMIGPTVPRDAKSASVGSDCRVMLDHVLKYYEPANTPKVVGKLEVRAFDREGNEVEVKR